MPPERTKVLVYELDAWYRSHNMRQKDLACELGLSPQQLSEILAMRNNPTGEQILIIQDFLKDNPMSSEQRVFEPKPDRPPRVDNPNQPRTLGAAQERIDTLNAELARLKSGAPTLPIGNIPAPAAAIPKPAPRTATAPPATAMEREIERARAARMEGLSNKPLAQQTVRELQAALNNAKPEDRAAIYSELKSRQGDTAMRAFKAGRR
jgi:transcriptional regulator with XRE-family HTH domain